MVKNLSTNAGDMGSIPGEMVTQFSFLAGKSHGQRSLAGYSLWVAKESNITEQLNNNNKSKSVSGDGIIQIQISDYELENE